MTHDFPTPPFPAAIPIIACTKFAEALEIAGNIGSGMMHLAYKVLQTKEVASHSLKAYSTK
ncbi:Uncharacterized protein NCS13_1_0182 [Neochlamydia sp. S13]|nr:Uncharacterized protein NCS13_1_0182 [Neochlamydia sp. S13]